MRFFVQKGETMKNKYRAHPILTFFFCLALLAGFAPAVLADETDTSPLADGAVAEVTINGTISQYSTLKEAFDAARTTTQDCTIKLLADASAGFTASIDSNITLDVSGHSITDGIFTIGFLHNSCTFTIFGNGSIANLQINRDSNYSISPTVNIQSVTFTDLSLNDSGITVNMTDGSINTATVYAGTMKINGGTVRLLFNSGGDTTINNGTVTAAYHNSGTMTVTGGTILTANSNGGTMTVGGGYISSLFVRGGATNLQSGATINTISHSGGTIYYTATNLELAPISQTLDTVDNQSGTITATITPDFTLSNKDSSLPVTWESNDTNVVKVSGTGRTATVTAVGVGKATITASSGGIEASCTVTVKAGTLPAPSDLAWSTPGQATWSEVTNASGYSVQLYNGTSAVGEAVSTTNTYYDFTSEMTQPGSYTFTVTATGDNKNYLPSKPTSQSTALNYYAVNFETDGGNTIESQVVVNDGKVTEPTIPTKANYTFAGWYSDSTFASAWNFDTPITEATTLYAKWTPNTYQVTLNTNGGTIHSGDVTEYTYGQVTALPTDVTRAGYTFGGWYDNEALTGKPVTAIGPAETGDKTFYAKWTENSSGGDSGEGSGGNTGEGAGSDTGSTGGSSGSSASGTTSGTSSSSGAAAQQATPYYTCPACGTHNWTATAEGYRCDNCGHIVTAQLSGYGNVKGSYDPASTSGTAANTASAIPQTGDSSEPALWAVVCLLSAGALMALGAARRRRQ